MKNKKKIKQKIKRRNEIKMNKTTQMYYFHSDVVSCNKFDLMEDKLSKKTHGKLYIIPTF
jgi:hypothetical protein